VITSIVQETQAADIRVLMTGPMHENHAPE
jgi:hypothetical protein